MQMLFALTVRLVIVLSILVTLLGMHPAPTPALGMPTTACNGPRCAYLPALLSPLPSLQVQFNSACRQPTSTSTARYHQIIGTINNRGSAALSNIILRLQLFNSSNGVITTTQIQPLLDTLLPGGSVPFSWRGLEDNAVCPAVARQTVEVISSTSSPAAAATRALPLHVLVDANASGNTCTVSAATLIVTNTHPVPLYHVNLVLAAAGGYEISAAIIPALERNMTATHRMLLGEQCAAPAFGYAQGRITP
jgi:hypothetical protein